MMIVPLVLIVEPVKTLDITGYGFDFLIGHSLGDLGHNLAAGIIITPGGT